MQTACGPPALSTGMLRKVLEHPRCQPKLGSVITDALMVMVASENAGQLPSHKLLSRDRHEAGNNVSPAGQGDRYEGIADCFIADDGELDGVGPRRRVP